MSDIAPNERAPEEITEAVREAMESHPLYALGCNIGPRYMFEAGMAFAAAHPVPEAAAELRDVLGELVRLKLMKPLMALPATDPRRPMSLPEYEIAKEVAWARAGEILSQDAPDMRQAFRGRQVELAEARRIEEARLKGSRAVTSSSPPKAAYSWGFDDGVRAALADALLDTALKACRLVYGCRSQDGQRHSISDEAMEACRAAVVASFLSEGAA